jgi:hypothetical protein
MPCCWKIPQVDRSHGTIFAAAHPCMCLKWQTLNSIRLTNCFKSFCVLQQQNQEWTILLNKYGYGNSHYFSLFAYNNQMVLRCGWIKKTTAHSFGKSSPLTWVGVNWRKDSGDHGHTYLVFWIAKFGLIFWISSPQNFYGPRNWN